RPPPPASASPAAAGTKQTSRRKASATSPATPPNPPTTSRRTPSPPKRSRLLRARAPAKRSGKGGPPGRRLKTLWRRPGGPPFPRSAHPKPVEWRASRALPTQMRTHFCGLIDESLVGETVTLCGWADVARDLGGLCFVDLRDHEGIVQVVAEPSDAEGNAAVLATAAGIGYEDCLRVTGTVRRREKPNPK